MITAENPQLDPASVSSPKRSLPELLAPAGDWECARAAVENGADAIYFGLEKFNARMRAQNFTQADLPKLMEFLHLRGVKGYVTFNTLVFSNEMAEAESYLRSIIAAGVDAMIVQDIGICRLIRKLSPDFPIHASTQMTVTSAVGVSFARQLDCQLVVLARECSIKEIATIRDAGKLGNESSVRGTLPMEVFVHGALCVAYSGQCLTSEALGGRSANRGECAQACRMPYELISDGKTVPLGDRRYLLSPQDLAGLEVLPQLVAAGVSSFKIEGRLKSPEYVANITRTYRQAINALAAPEASQKIKTDSRYDLEMAFSRGLHTGWLGGINNQQLVHARFGKKRGVYLGEIKAVRGESVAVALVGPLKPGDGIVFDRGHPDEKEEGGRVYSVEPGGKESRLTFKDGAVNFGRIATGDKVWKTSDPELDRRLRQTFAGDAPQFHRSVDAEVHGTEGKALTLLLSDDDGHIARADSTVPLAKAEKQPLTKERLREQLGRLGGTPFELRHLQLHLQPGLILPVSELNRMRRDAVNQLQLQRAKPQRWQMNLPATPHFESFRQGLKTLQRTQEAAPELIILIRNLSQLEVALSCGIETLYCEFEDPKKYRDAVTLFRSVVDSKSNRTIWVVPPRIFKAGEDWILRLVKSSEPDGFLVRNYDHLESFEGSRMRGDFSLNVANELTAEYFIRQFDLERVTASYDLNLGQLEALLHAAPPEWFEITLHQHMPLFHMEHCVFCAFLSTGKDYKDCGRPCDHHEVRLRDRVGAEHPLKADAGCRNTLFNARAQTGAEYLTRLVAAGARNFRVDFLNEPPDEVSQTITMYRDLLAGKITGARLWKELRLINQLGVTRGQM